jgi:hypothetical protein
MNRQSNPSNAFSRSEWMLWIAITLYTSLIYSTLSLVPLVRKMLVERYGYDIFDWIFVLYGLAALGIIIYGVRTFRGFTLLRYFTMTAAAAAIFVWYLLRLPFAIERIHLLEYGLLGMLFCVALRRRLSKAAAYCAAIIATYITGLGDEAIQGVLASRVGEIRDALTNLISGLFGVFSYGASFGSGRLGPAFTVNHLQAVILLAAAATLGTGVFLPTIQGFGYEIEDKHSWFYSSIPPRRLAAIQKTGIFISPAEEKTFENEAKRHLFQRDFYFANDFLAKDRSYYRDYNRSLGENRILENWYKPFLQKYGREQSAAFSGKTDRKVGKDLGTLPVAWPDGVKVWVTHQAGQSGSRFTSRVKSTVITSFNFNQMLAAAVLALVVLGIGWFAAGRKKKAEGR